jgi:chemotaxis protein MotB
MKTRYLKVLSVFLAVVISISFIGCAVRFQKRHPKDVERIKELSQKLQQLQQTQDELQARLQEEISRGEVSLQMKEKGLVVTVVAKVLFDSGRAEVRPGGKEVLAKVADVLGKIDENILIEGHTDNVPIKYSGWQSNWELSSHRALNVLHYFVDDKGLSPSRFAAVGYGSYRPIASNDIEEGRQKNRRVEIVVLPAKLEKVKKTGNEQAPAQLGEYIK